MEPSDFDGAVSGLAYNFVMLGEALHRIRIMLAGHDANRSEPPFVLGSDGILYSREPVYSTGSDAFVARVESYPLNSPVEVPASLTEYRAYFEWALTLARKLSEVVSAKPKMYPTDVRASDLIGDPAYHLPTLPKEVITRIDQAVAHQTYIRHDGPGWGIPEITVWREETLGRLVDDFRKTRPDVANRGMDDLVGDPDDTSNLGFWCRATAPLRPATLGHLPNACFLSR
jgi:hypothetical protein